MAVVIAVGVNGNTGEREVLGLDAGPSEDGAFLDLLSALFGRPRASRVQLVTSDAHQGLKGAIAAVVQGAAWQRCRVHFMRNALALVPKAAQPMVGATIRTVFAQPDADSAREQWRRVADGFRARFPKLAQLLDEAEADVLAYPAFPGEHWRQIWSNNPLERAQQGGQAPHQRGGDLPQRGGGDSAGRRDPRSEQHDEWQVAQRYFSAGSLAKLERTRRDRAAAVDGG